MWIRGRSPGWRGLVFAGLAAACTLSGCMAKSVAPIVGEKESEFDASLIGTWKGEGKASAVVTASGREYHILYTDVDGKPGRFVGRLGHLGTRRVLDVSPEVEGSDFYTGLLLPFHAFLFLDSNGHDIRAWTILDDSLQAYLEREPTAIAHMKAQDRLVLTAPTQELKPFLERFAARPGVLDSATWQRR